MSMFRFQYGLLFLLASALCIASTPSTARAVSDDELGRILLHGAYQGVTQGFSPGSHAGMDFAAKVGTALYSPVTGKVAKIDIGNGLLAIKGTGTYQGYTFIFLHLSQVSVREQQAVNPSTYLGKTGKTLYKGVAITAPHLHIECRPTQFVVPATSKERGSVTNPTSVVQLEVLRVGEIQGPSSIIAGRGAQYSLSVDFSDLSKRSYPHIMLWTVSSSKIAAIGQRGYLSVLPNTAGKSLTINANLAGQRRSKTVSIRAK